MKRTMRPSRGNPPCESMGPDDGIDARLLFRGTSRRKSHHKTYQLCNQVLEAINGLLSHLGDDRLEAVLVDAVTPAPDDGRLLVLVRQAITRPGCGPSQVLEALQGAHGLIRCEVAGAVTRRRAPELVFQVLPDSPVSHG